MSMALLACVLAMGNVSSISEACCVLDTKEQQGFPPSSAGVGNN